MKSQGVGKGDDVTIYMPMIPEVRTHRTALLSGQAWPGLGVPPTCPAAPRRLPLRHCHVPALVLLAHPPAGLLAHVPAPNPARPHHCSCPPSCWRARASAPCSLWCLPASLPSPWRAASPTPHPRWCARPAVPAAQWPGKLCRACIAACQPSLRHAPGAPSCLSSPLTRAAPPACPPALRRW